MIILTAGHTGAGTGAQCATTQFDEGAENIWLRNRVAEILTNKYGLVVLMDDDRASLKLLTQALTDDLSFTEDGLQSTDLTPPPYRHLPYKQGRNHESAQHLKILPLFIGGVPEGGGGSTIDDFVIDIHFNAHSNPQARGAETIVSDDATTLELQFASRLAHVTADALDIPLRSIKSESETPHRRLGMLHLTPQSIILEVCFITSPDDVEAYLQHREKLAEDLAWAIYELI